MVPTTGAGPGGSIIGNALEKGFGLNPVTDHFASVISLRVLLPTGEIFTSRLADMGAHFSDLVSKWKVGSCIEGLFAQSGLGIVLRATIELAPRPEKIYICMVKAEKSQFKDLIEIIQTVRRRFRGELGGINVSNCERMLSTIAEEKNEMKISPLKRWFERIAGLDFLDYQAIIPVYIYDEAQLTVIKSIKKIAKKNKLQIKVISSDDIKTLVKVIDKFKLPFTEGIFHRLGEALELAKIVKGQPSSFALKLAYNENKVTNKGNHPARDGVGLFWFAPILPLRPEDLQAADSICAKVLIKHGQKHMLTFTNFDQKLTEATIPIYFDQSSPESRQKALDCWEELFNEFLKVGYAPYRYSILHMKFAEFRSPHLQKIQKELKEIFDPQRAFCEWPI